MALFDLSFVDELAATDSLAVELLSLEPQIEDAIAVTDSLAIEMDLHVELADSIAVTDSIAFELSQVPNEIHVQIEDSIAVTDVIEALNFDGSVHTITSVTPQRGRAGETITIAGTGFSPNNNNVRLDGTTATIVTENTTEIVITQPTTFNVTDGFAILQVNNFDNNRVTEVPYWIKDAIADIEAGRLPDQEPGPEEFAASVTTGTTGAVTGAIVPDPTRAEARMWERMATMVDFLLRDTLVALGDMFVCDATGLTLLDGSSGSEVAGQRLIADSAASEGLRWGREVDADFPYGIQIAAATVTAVLMTANGINSVGPTGDGDEWVVPLDGTIDGVYVYQQSSVPNTDRLDRVRILVNGSSDYDSGTGLSIGHRGRHFAGSLSIAVTAGQRIQLEVTKTGTSETMDLLGAVRMQTT